MCYNIKYHQEGLHAQPPLLCPGDSRPEYQGQEAHDGWHDNSVRTGIHPASRIPSYEPTQGWKHKTVHAKSSPDLHMCPALPPSQLVTHTCTHRKKITNRHVWHSFFLQIYLSFCNYRCSVCVHMNVTAGAHGSQTVWVHGAGILGCCAAA